MRQILADSANWGLAAMAAGMLVAILVAGVLGFEFPSAVVLVVVLGGVGLCLGPIAMIVHHAAHIAGAARLAQGSLWGAAWGFVLGLLYTWLYDNTLPLWHLVVPVTFLAAAGLINTALNIHTQAVTGKVHSRGKSS